MVEEEGHPPLQKAQAQPGNLPEDWSGDVFPLEPEAQPSSLRALLLTTSRMEAL